MDQVEHRYRAINHADNKILQEEKRDQIIRQNNLQSTIKVVKPLSAKVQKQKECSQIHPLAVDPVESQGLVTKTKKVYLTN